MIRKIQHVLLATLGLYAVVAQATVFEGTLSGATTQEPSATPAVPWAQIGFHYDSGMSFHLGSTDNSTYARYDSPFPSTDRPLYFNAAGIGRHDLGMRNTIELFNDAAGQTVKFSSDSPHEGVITVTLAGSAGALFDNLLDLSTLHAGPFDASRSQGTVGTRWAIFELNPPNVSFSTPVPEPETWLLMGIGLAACLWLARRRAYPALTGYVPSP